MSTMKISQHAQIRMQQRGLSHRDIELLFIYGTHVDHNALILMDKTADKAITKLKKEGHHREAKELQRLRGKCLIIRDNTLVTCYHANDKQIKKMLKK